MTALIEGRASAGARDGVPRFKDEYIIMIIIITYKNQPNKTSFLTIPRETVQKAIEYDSTVNAGLLKTDYTYRMITAALALTWADAWTTDVEDWASSSFHSRASCMPKPPMARSEIPTAISVKEARRATAVRAVPLDSRSGRRSMSVFSRKA
jgi:hypothetical protein